MTLSVRGDEHTVMVDRLTSPLATDTSTVSPSSHTPTGYNSAAKLILPVRPTLRVVVGSSAGSTGTAGSDTASRNRSHGTTSPMP